MNLPTTKRWERKTSARFWSAPVLWRFPTRSKAAEDCRPSSVAALRRVDSPRRWREDQRSLSVHGPDACTPCKETLHEPALTPALAHAMGEDVRRTDEGLG